MCISIDVATTSFFPEKNYIVKQVIIPGNEVTIFPKHFTLNSDNSFPFPFSVSNY
jgi:hypothetical protein